MELMSAGSWLEVHDNFGYFIISFYCQGNGMKCPSVSIFGSKVLSILKKGEKGEKPSLRKLKSDSPIDIKFTESNFKFEDQVTNKILAIEFNIFV